ncbi:hypothetical protein HOD08_00195, partial [bacterium]|nr:hypothetical protein [bacterium]
ALNQSSQKNPALDFANKKIGGHECSLASSLTTPNKKDVNYAKRSVGVVKSPVGIIPRAPEIPENVAYLGDSISALPSDGAASMGTMYRLDPDTSYSALAESASTDVDTRVANRAVKGTLWAVPFREMNSAGTAPVANVTGAETGGVMNIVKGLSTQGTENAIEWLKDRGYEMESFSVTDVGDADLEVFYEYDLSHDFTAEASAGFRIPVGGESKYDGNPYKIQVGNGRHWELKGGCLIAWQPASWINIKGDLTGSIVLPRTEDRCAVFKYSKIRSFGPMAKAKVNWKYCVARADCTFFHPRGKAVATNIGYEFYFKQKDNFSFNDISMNSWLGKLSTNGINYLDDKKVLDDVFAVEETESIAHRIKVEASLRITEQCELFLGGGYTFAGQNIPREIDAHFGFHAFY